jgi:hypothetical protein
MSRPISIFQPSNRARRSTKSFSIKMSVLQRTVTILSLATLLVICAAHADELKVLSISPNKKVRIITKIGKDQNFYEELRPHAKKTLLGEGIYARFVGSDSPDSTLSSPDQNSVEAYVEWDPSSTRVFITQGDAKAWYSSLFILRKDVRTGHLFFQEPDLPQSLPSLLSQFTKISREDIEDSWEPGICNWKDKDQIILSLSHMNAGWIDNTEECEIKFYFATRDLLNLELTKIDYTGVLPSESERAYETGKPRYSDKVKTLYVKGEQAGAGQPANRPESKSKGSDKPQPDAEWRSR